MTRILLCRSADISYSDDIERSDFSLENQTSRNIQEAVQILSSGQVVAMPTETVYGLAADATNENAVRNIFKAKNRPSDNPLIVHVSDLRMLREFCGDLEPQYLPLISKFWPGPLTILVPRSDKICRSVLGSENMKTVAVRMPNHPVARALISSFGKPLAAPSANLSGRPSPTNATHVFDDLEGKIPLILSDDLEITRLVGLESTVVDANRDPPLVLRPGGISLENIKTVAGFHDVIACSDEGSDNRCNETKTPSTPGMKYRHYSPNAKVYIKDAGQDEDELLKKLWNDGINYVGLISIFQQQKSADENSGFKIHFGLKSPNQSIRWHESPIESTEQKAIRILIQDDPSHSEFSRYLFFALRHLDKQNVDIIIVPEVSKDGMGLAIMNRLKKASSNEDFVTKF